MSITVVAHNLMAVNGSRQLNINAKNKAKSIEKLASGYGINRSSDDAAGLSISEKLRQQVRGLNRGQQNAQDGISFCQVADGAMSEIHSMLNRMQELCVQAANGTNSVADRSAIQQEINQIVMEINRISDTTTFNDQLVFHGSDGSGGLNIRDILGNNQIKGGSSMGEPLTILQTINSTGNNVTLATEGQDGCAGLVGGIYPSVMLDFSGLGTDYTADELIGKSFCTQDTETGEKYNIVFGNAGDTGGKHSLYAGAGNIHTLTINVEGQSIGGNLVNRLYHALGNTAAFTDGHIQYAKDGNGKLWVYDNRSANLSNSPLNFGLKADNTPQVPAGGSNDSTQHEDDIWIQSGADTESGLWLERPNLSAGELGVEGIDVSSADGAKNALNDVGNAIEILSSKRAKIGAQQNRLEYNINATAIAEENLDAAESLIRDADMVDESMNFMKANILEQAGQMVLAQANQAPESVMSLLQ